jgi:methylase of polypeptide subunit release factors
MKSTDGRFKVYVQGECLVIQTARGVEPTPFSLFVANMVTPRRRDIVAIDAGAGSGILAIALARLGVQRVIGVERSALACEVFEHNVRGNGVESQVEIVHGDIADFEPDVPAHLVIANPPTIPEHPGLPDFVLGGGPDGMDFLRLLLARSVKWLSPRGLLQFVVSSLIEDQELAGLAAAHNWRLHAVGSELVPLRSFYKEAYGTRRDGGLQLPGGAQDGRVFHESEIITVYRADRDRTRH